MRRNHALFILASGLAAGALFGVSVGESASGTVLIYLPAFPLLLLGLSLGTQSAARACVVAFLVAIVMASPGGAIVSLVIILLPSLWFLTRALLWRKDETGQHWYPVTRILSELAGFVSALFAASSFLLGHFGKTPLQHMIAPELASGFSSPDPQVMQAMKWLTTEGSFLLFSTAAWLWLLMLYLMAVMANSLLVPKKLALRESLALEPRHLPGWLMALTAVSAALAFMGTGNDLFLGRALFLILLLPYLLEGLAVVHASSKAWKARGLLIGFIYAVLLLLLWPCLFIIGLGLYSQLSEMLDKGRTIR